MSKKTFYVTTPIYYPSGNLHIGHVYTTSLAWVLRNYKRAKGYDAIMLTGSDEHGQKIENKAKSLNISPQKYVDNMSNEFKKLWKLLDIDYDIFIRTTNKNHVEAVRKQFSSLFKKNQIYKGHYKGLYSINDEEFLTKINSVKKGDHYYHPTSGHKLEEVEEESYFFKMSNYEKWLKEYFHNNSDFIFPKTIYKELLNNFINKGLENLSVSRKSFKWGVSIKENKDHIIYVWLDALNNYITALGYNQKDNAQYKKYWENGDEIVHIIGKEITRFHCIYWPIILKANEIRQPTKILSHGWILTSEGKMSKSKGNVVNPVELIKKYGNEQIKYYLVSKIHFGKDGVFKNEDFIKTINADLSNNIGNLVSRTIAMILQNFKKPIKFLKNNNKDDQKIINTIQESFHFYKKHFDEFNISAAIQKAVYLSKELNGYIDITQTWTLKNDKKRLEEILNILLNGIYAVITMLNVIMPKSMKKIQKQINIDKLCFQEVLNFNKFDNILVQKGNIVFEKI